MLVGIYVAFIDAAINNISKRLGIGFLFYKPELDVFLPVDNQQIMIRYVSMEPVEEGVHLVKLQTGDHDGQLPGARGSGVFEFIQMGSAGGLIGNIAKQGYTEQRSADKSEEQFAAETHGELFGSFPVLVQVGMLSNR